MQSCDTFAVSKNYNIYNQNLFAKNSDRPLGEAQKLCYFESKDFEKGEMIKCTHLTIPQVSHTYAMIGSQPYWIWGFEMGVNEHGLMIGNEAQGSVCPAENEEGLLGMDLLRLALERAKTAREAIDVITQLLEKYGQNANASMLFDRRYENSYLMVDNEEIWLLETAGRHWAAKKIDDWHAISNCYSIEKDFDMTSEGLESYIRTNKLLSSNEPLNFAKAFTKPAIRQTNAVPRWRRMNKLLSGFGNNISFDKCKSILRDHHNDEITEPRFGAVMGTFCSICMHAQTWDAAQTVAGFITTYDDNLGIIGRFAPSTPCLSVFVPFYFNAPIPEVLSKGDGSYDKESLWWAVERLAMGVTIDEERFAGHVKDVLSSLENEIESKTYSAGAKAKALIKNGKSDEAWKTLGELSQESCLCIMNAASELADEIFKTVSEEGGIYGPRKELLTDYFERVKITF